MDNMKALLRKSIGFLLDHRSLLVIALTLYGLVFIVGVGFYSGFIYMEQEGLVVFSDSDDEPSSFVVSFIASATQDVLFFLIVGLVVFSLGQKDPKEEDLVTKVKHIFPGVEPGTPLSIHLREQINKLSCISPKVTRHVTIAEYCPTKKAFKVYIKTNTYVKNIHNNAEYATDEMRLALNVDKVEPEDDIYGQVLDISIVYDVKNPTKNMHQKGGVITLKGSNEYSTSFSLKLEAEQEALYHVHTWSWQDMRKSLRFGALRFTELQEIVFCNKTGENIKVIQSNSDNPITLSEGQSSSEITRDHIEPGEWTAFSIEVIAQEERENDEQDVEGIIQDIIDEALDGVSGDEKVVDKAKNVAIEDKVAEVQAIEKAPVD